MESLQLNVDVEDDLQKTDKLSLLAPSRKTAKLNGFSSNWYIKMDFDVFDRCWRRSRRSSCCLSDMISFAGFCFSGWEEPGPDHQHLASAGELSSHFCLFFLKNVQFSVSSEIVCWSSRVLLQERLELLLEFSVVLLVLLHSWFWLTGFSRSFSFMIIQMFPAGS